MADSGSAFSSWSGDLTGALNPETILVNANKNITAAFIAQFALTINTVENGSVILNPPGGVYATGTVVTLTPDPDTLYQFDNWSGDLTGSTSPATLTIDSDKTVIANFSETPLATYQMFVAPFGNGSVTLNPPGGIYTQGTVVTMTAIPDSGHLFSGWLGDVLGAENPINVTMDATKSVVASFTEIPPTQFALNVSSIGSGTVTASPAGLLFEEGTVVTLTAAAAAGFQFTGWSGDITTTDNPSTITMDGNKNVIATFEAVNSVYSLTVNLFGSGSVSLDPPGGVYTQGTVVTVQAIPASGFQFTTWVGDLTGTISPSTITMDGDKLITAIFTELAANQRTLTMQTQGTGTVTLNPPGGVYDVGTVVTLTALPGDGFQFDNWSGDVTGTISPTTVTVDDNKTVTATFSQSQIQQYTLTTNSTGLGSVTLNPAGGVYDEGTVVTLTAVPQAGYIFGSWTGDLSGIVNPITLTMDGNKIVTAAFNEVVNQFTLNIKCYRLWHYNTVSCRRRL